ncbi:MAG TPA: aspartate--tRNA(Asn) ligase [Spirochaetia bacterium]|nr:aspartate--tRNA(Asn) ligase [Spirochaetia bacterium]
MRTLASELPGKVGTAVSLSGWVHRIRDLGKVSFVVLRDRSGSAQLVFSEKPDVTVESVIRVEGTASANEKAPGGVEVRVEKLEVLSAAAVDLPFPVNQEPGKTSLESILDNRMISVRNPSILSIFRVQSSILRGFAEHMRSEGFSEIKTSKLIGTGTEGGTGLFAVEYFDTRVYLTQSPQLYKQAMIASGLERVFEIGPAYRAEKHDTPRHINEFVSLDVEMAFIESEQELMDLETRILASIFTVVREANGKDLEAWKASVPDPEACVRIPRVSHDEAREIVSKETGRKAFEITPEGERTLCDWAQKTAGIDAAFVHGYPRKSRPFYTFPADNNKTRAFDLLFRGLEVTSGGMRINQYDMLVENAKTFGLDPAGLADYLSIFRYGCPPHGGFAIGLERLTQKILGLGSVKEATLFPRDRKRVRP